MGLSGEQIVQIIATVDSYIVTDINYQQAQQLPNKRFALMLKHLIIPVIVILVALYIAYTWTYSTTLTCHRVTGSSNGVSSQCRASRDYLFRGENTVIPWQSVSNIYLVKNDDTCRIELALPDSQRLPLTSHYSSTQCSLFAEVRQLDDYINTPNAKLNASNNSTKKAWGDESNTTTAPNKQVTQTVYNVLGIRVHVEKTTRPDGAGFKIRLGGQSEIDEMNVQELKEPKSLSFGGSFFPMLGALVLLLLGGGWIKYMMKTGFLTQIVINKQRREVTISYLTIFDGYERVISFDNIIDIVFEAEMDSETNIMDVKKHELLLNNSQPVDVFIRTDYSQQQHINREMKKWIGLC